MTKANVATRTAAPEKGSRGLLSTVAAEESGAKKRKREDLDQSDPKLQEYLRVMRTGRESLVADETAVESSGAPLVQDGGALVPDGESDDEYVEVPSRKEKLRKVDHATGETGVDPVTLAREPASRKADGTAHADGVAGEPDGSSAPDSSAANQPADVAMEATDDDWLRSRTNRLLDLVDPDDLSHVAPVEKADCDSSPAQEAGIDNKEAPHSEQDGTHEGQDELPPQGQDKDSAAEAISRTSRLFVRNLPYSATEDDLRETFEKFGGVDEVSCLFSYPCFVILFFLRCFFLGLHDEPQIGTAYTLCVFDENLGDYFSRCFDCLMSCHSILFQLCDYELDTTGHND